ncbi:FAD binding domain-containing protein [Amorphus coralli]|uniref:FAD binding domain-containing protein n=1 Tax=Amorphus coralli TaxID=340680 RepID=UPI00037C5390|nr:FAD binding domain-containing protein [Amorphus coralli]
MVAAHEARLHVATSVDDAVAVLTEAGGDAVPMAGATWLMRAELRDEPIRPLYVALGRIEALKGVEIAADAVSIGACVTHAELAGGLAGLPEMRGLAQAAGHAATPAVRAVATVGGNLAASGFAAADLAPALLAADAEVEVAGSNGTERLPLAGYLATRDQAAAGSLIVRVIVPRGDCVSAHTRLPLRVAGDYPVAIVSMNVAVSPDGTIADLRIGVGSVEPVAARWTALEEALASQPLDPEAAATAAREHAGVFAPRDGVEASGAYRVRVLPALVRRAIEALAASR